MRVVVVGLGAMGLPTAWALAARGHDVVGLDRHGIASPVGSSAGATRIVRLAHDRPSDVRLARRALERWRELEAGCGATLVDPVGLLVRGAGGAAYGEALRAEGVPCEELDDAGVERVFPELARRPGEPALLVPGDGAVMARAGLEAMAAAARAAGAELAAPERVVAIAETAVGVRVDTDRRALEADAVVVAAGPWAAELLDPVGVRLALQPAIGQVTYWRGGAWERRPALIDFPAGGRMGVYGLPTPGKGYKIGLDYGDEAAWRPEAGEWPVRSGEEAENAAWVAAHAPGLAADGPHASECCPWTMTPDGDFLYGRRGAIVVAAGCCGHGFKHAPVLGEILADLAEGRPLDPDAAPWALERMPSDAAFERVETPMGARISL
jgi:glycine/D-amino acid oxidase-like deaminating enzyme